MSALTSSIGRDGQRCTDFVLRPVGSDRVSEKTTPYSVGRSTVIDDLLVPVMRAHVVLEQARAAANELESFVSDPAMKAVFRSAVDDLLGAGRSADDAVDCFKRALAALPVSGSDVGGRS